MDRHDPSSSLEKDSVRLRKPGALPPLQGSDGGGGGGPRTHSAPEGVGRPGQSAGAGAGAEDGTTAASAVMEALHKARSKQDKHKKLGDAEKNLFNSPFAQPLLKIQDGQGGKGSPQH